MTVEKLNALFEAIEAGNTEVAEYCGFDRTNISRLRSGKRELRRDSSTAGKLAGGICRYAAEHGKQSALCTLTGASPCTSTSEVEMREAVLKWLFGETEKRKEESPAAPSGTIAYDELQIGREKEGQPRYRSFGERLDKVMVLAEMSNVRLSRMIHTDASLISRYRSGIQMPRHNPELAQALCAALYGRVVKLGKKEELATQMLFSEKELDERYFAAWLLEEKGAEAYEIQAAEGLLKTFDSITGELPMKIFDAEIPEPEDIKDGMTSIYFGTEGLRSAVLRFLAEALKGNAQQLFLYSDEEQRWMTEDTAFLRKWAALMSACVRNGTQIRIIHNVDRNLGEMSEAIKNWLPLYMSGRIDSRYSTLPRGERFFHTVFLWPGRACIKAAGVRGTQADGIYHYYTGERELGICEQEYRRLLENTRPLIKTAALKPGEETGFHMMPIPETPYRNVCLRIGREYAEISYVSCPSRGFRFTHPLLCRAFREYADMLMNRHPDEAAPNASPSRSQYGEEAGR